MAPGNAFADERNGQIGRNSRLTSAKRMLRKFWRGLREWSGDAAYESYLRSPRTPANASQMLSPAEFYVEQLNRRYSRPNRCC